MTNDVSILSEILCFIVFVLFVGVFAWFLYHLLKIETKRAVEHKNREDTKLNCLIDIRNNLSDINENLVCLNNRIFFFQDAYEKHAMIIEDGQTLDLDIKRDIVDALSNFELSDNNDVDDCCRCFDYLNDIHRDFMDSKDDCCK